MMADGTQATRRLVLLIRLHLRRSACYRANVILDLLGALLTVFVLCLFWSAVFRSQTAIAGLDLAYMLRYVLLVRLILTATSPSGVAREIADRVRDGSLLVELVRPYGLLSSIVAQCVSSCLWRMVWIAPPLVIALAILSGPSLALCRLPSFLLALLIAGTYNIGVEVLLALSAFWLKRNEGVLHARGFLDALLSGALVPLALFPESFQHVLAWMPFRGMIDVPIGVLLGDFPHLALLHPAAWGLLVWIICSLLHRKALHRFDALGG